MNEVEQIKELIERYYEGLSSDADEALLREYFASPVVADELDAYRPIFVCMAQQRAAFENRATVHRFRPASNIRHRQMPKRRILWTVAGLAAAACAAFAIIKPYTEPQPVGNCTGTYVIVDGVCSDDPALVRKYVIQSLDDCLPSEGSPSDSFDYLELSSEEIEVLRNF